MPANIVNFVDYGKTRMMESNLLQNKLIECGPLSKLIILNRRYVSRIWEST